MKHFYILILLIGCFSLLTMQIKAQAPNSLNYQGVARNSSGVVLSNQNISLRFTIHQGSAGGTVVYQETKAATTNQLGLFTVAVGSGSVVSGNFTAINWAANTEYLQVEMDPTGGTSYLDMGTNQFLSVPYALSSGSGWNLTGNSSTNGTDYIGTTDANDLIFKTHNNEVMRVANTSSNVGIGTSSSSPNAGAVLDVNSSTQGMLIPRLAGNPTSPAQAMMYFNTTSGCFMFYNSNTSTWQSIVCGCPSVITAGAITSSTGSGNFCPGTSGVNYSIAALNNATGYQWTVPTGATITGGQGSNAITVTEGTVSGNVVVTPSNNCGTGTASTLAVIPVPTVIGTQPASAGVFGTGTATFTVAATGGALTYQWQVNTGSGYAPVSNGGFYSGATTVSLSVSNPISGMNGYLYECIVTGTCGSVTSNPATLTVCASSASSVNITLTNSQSSATPANFPVMITVNSSTYSSLENSALNNIEFSTGGGGGGTVLQAWIESGNTSSSTSTVYWVNLGSATVPANGTLTIYMDFMPSSVLSATGPTGEAPQLSGTYGQYDNGASVFTFYDNFAGTSLSAKWGDHYVNESATMVVNNGVTFNSGIAPNTHFYVNTITSASTFAPNVVEDVHLTAVSGSGGGVRSLMPGLVNQTATPEGNYLGDMYFSTVCSCAPPTSYVGLVAGKNGSPAAYWFQQGNSSSVTNPYYSWAGTYSVAANDVISIYYTGSTNYLYQNYTQKTSLNTFSPTGSLYFALGVDADNGGSYSFTTNWARARAYPPNAVMPTAAFGSAGCH